MEREWKWNENGTGMDMKREWKLNGNGNGTGMEIKGE